MISDVHFHTFFSPDSKEDPRKYIEKAISLGMPYLCFTDHCDIDYYDENEGSFFLDKFSYFNTLYPLRDEYKKDIHVLIGVEQGLEVSKADKINNFLDNEDFDYIIGSSHMVNGVDPYYPSFFDGRTVNSALNEYFDSVIENINTFDNFDVYGHIDYVARYISDSSYEYSYEQFKEKIDYILKLLIEKGKGIEINTGGYRSKLNAPNPCVDIVKSYNKLGGKIITVGSDAHKIDDFSSDFDKIPNILSQCNFDYYNVFSKRKPVKIPL